MKFHINKIGKVFEVREIATDRLVAVQTSYRAALAYCRMA